MIFFANAPMDEQREMREQSTSLFLRKIDNTEYYFASEARVAISVERD